jgi:cytidylate kinase
MHIDDLQGKLMFPVITIDGPSGVGKGTLCQKIAHAFNWRILDSGSLYRLTALAANIDQVDLKKHSLVGDIARNLQVSFTGSEAGLIIRLRGNDVTKAIRQESMGMMASKIAAIDAVREALLERQRAFLEAPGLVADGRDMGTTVFPQAKLKIFITASCEERARRRYKQLKQKGISASLPALVADLTARDEQDANRAVSPLKPADDAIVIDTTEMSIDAVTSTVLELARKTFDS